MKFASVDELLQFAIQEEINAAAFYRGLADRVDRPWMKQTFLDFAKEEMGHKAVLEGIRDGGELEPLKEEILNLNILELLEVKDVPAGDIDYRQALVIAMQAEKEAFILYNSLAEMTDEPALKKVLTRLAQEEAKHKLRFETEYDEFVFQEN